MSTKKFLDAEEAAHQLSSRLKKLKEEVEHHISSSTKIDKVTGLTEDIALELKELSNALTRLVNASQPLSTSKITKKIEDNYGTVCDSIDNLYNTLKKDKEDASSILKESARKTESSLVSSNKKISKKIEDNYGTVCDSIDGIFKVLKKDKSELSSSLDNTRENLAGFIEEKAKGTNKRVLETAERIEGKQANANYTIIVLLVVIATIVLTK